MSTFFLRLYNKRLKILGGAFILAAILIFIAALIFNDLFEFAIALLTLAVISVIGSIIFYIYTAILHRRNNLESNADYQFFSKYINFNLDRVNGKNYNECFKLLTDLENLHYNYFFNSSKLNFDYTSTLASFKKYSEDLRDRTKDDKDYVYMNILATGNDSMNSKIVRIILFKYKNSELVDTLDRIVNPGVYVPLRKRFKNKIKNKTIKSAPAFRVIIDDVISFIGNDPIVSIDSVFDYNILTNEIYKITNKDIKYTVKKSMVNINDVCSIDTLNSINTNDIFKDKALKNALAFSRE